MPDLTIKVTSDIGPWAAEWQAHLSPTTAMRAVGAECARLTREHLHALPGNPHGWPRTYFYHKAGRSGVRGAGTAWDLDEQGTVTITVDHPDAPGAMKHLFHGGPIRMKNKRLTIPARAEAYGARATEFTNLRLVVFGRTGKMALAAGREGVGRVSFETGKERRVLGPRQIAREKRATEKRLLIFYWLRESVETGPHPEVLPTVAQYGETARDALARHVEEGRR